ncbi:MAG TPA: S8 family serine peptidase [Nitriliruptorales bacterium]
MTAVTTRTPSTVRSALLAALATLALALPQIGLPVLSAAPAPAPAPAPAASVAIDPSVPDMLATTGTVEVIVQVDPFAAARARSAVQRSGGTVLRDLPIVQGFEARLTPEALQALTGTPGVRAVTLDGEVYVQSETSEDGSTTRPLDSSFVEHIGADDLHAQGYDGAGVGIALIDTGVNPVTDLAGRVVGGIDLSGEANDVDSYGHGTFIAGIAAGDGTASAGEHAGVAPGAHVVSVKIAGASGSTDVSNVLAAIQWVVSFKADHDIGVLNLAIGTDSAQSYTLDPLNFAVERAWAEGIVVVVSASNRGPEAGTISKPADDPWVITVGSVDSEGTETRTDDTLASFSGRGPTVADAVVKPDLVVPGVSLVGTRAHGSTVAEAYPVAYVGDDYMRGTGTSFSAAVVSGAVAVLRQAHPDWTPDQVKAALMGTAAPGPVGDPNADGAGAVDLVAASALVDPAAANQGLQRSSGTGSMAAARGSLAISVKASATAEARVLDRSVGRTAQDDSWDSVAAEEFRTGVWSASEWYASEWYASEWY